MADSIDYVDTGPKAIPPRIATVTVSKLQDTYDYEVNFPSYSQNVILIAPNGYGKTALLSLLKSCFELNITKISEHKFRSCTIIFDDNTKWIFEKSAEQKSVGELLTEVDLKTGVRRRRRRKLAAVTARFYDSSGNEVRIHGNEMDRIDPSLLYRAIERFSFLSRETYDGFRDPATGEILSSREVIARYGNTLLNDADFRQFVSQHSPEITMNVGHKLNCVFIETQRLLSSLKRSTQHEQIQSDPQEEIVRQALHLASLLQDTYSNYASISQALDRSFPNRLVEKAKDATPADPFQVKENLNKIEEKRRLLTNAGILVEQSAQLAPPADEYLPKVADALQIYVSDSKEKLATFDTIYPKISAFRDLVSRKLKPKELIINRERGVEIRRGGVVLPIEGLSSGEKHEFIMLFKLIFETPMNSVVLIDEPEISLHVLWQLEFMSDLLRIQETNAFQAIIATHSPQIFQGNEHLIVDLADQV